MYASLVSSVIDTSIAASFPASSGEKATGAMVSSAVVAVGMTDREYVWSRVCGWGDLARTPLLWAGTRSNGFIYSCTPHRYVGG